MWTAIKYVGSAVTLVAFIAAVAAWLYRSRLLSRERLLRTAPEQERAALVERTLVLFKVDAERLKRDQRYDLALRQIQGQASRYRTTAAVVVTIAVLAAALTSIALLKPSQPAPATPTPSTTPTPLKLSGKIEQVEVAENPGGGSQAFIRLSIRNEGPPTPVQKYYIRVTHVTTSVIDFKDTPADLGERVTVPRPAGRGQIVIEPQDAIARKTEQAVAEGGEVSGWLRIALPLPMLTPKDLRQPGIRYVVSFTDAAGKQYEAAHEVR